MNTESREALLAHLVVDEGVILYAYQDSLGYWSLGCGRLIDKRRGGGITHEEALYLLNNDVERHWRELLERFQWIEWLDDVRQVAFANLAFNLGVAGLAKFVNTMKAAEQGDWEAVARGLRTSLWFRQVQPSRSSRIIHMLLYGRMP